MKLPRGTTRNKTLGAGMARLVFIVAIVAASAVGLPAHPAAAFDNDTHFYLTYYLAREVGYSREQAYRIALADVSVDVDPHTEPFQLAAQLNPLGDVDPQEARIAFHAFLDERKYDNLADPDQVQQALADREERARALWDTAQKTGNPGEYLHFLQDEFAHRDSTTHVPYGSADGHAAEGHTPDYLSNDPDGSWEMVQATIVALQQFAAANPELGVTYRNVDTTKQGHLYQVYQALLNKNPASYPYSYLFAPDAQKAKEALEELGDLGLLPTFDESDAYKLNVYGEPEEPEAWRLPASTAASATATPTRGAARPGASDWGDTHLVTFDRGHYDFQQVGEYVVAKSDLDDFEIQARQEPWRSSCRVTVNTAVAFHVGGHKVGVYLTNPGVQTVIDDQAADVSGKPIALPDGGTVSVNAAAHQETVTWPNGSFVVVNYGRGSYMNLSISLAESERGHMSGLLGNSDGNPTNDFTTRDGQVLASPVAKDQLYGAFSDSWRVDQAESLFSYADGRDTNTFTNPDFPCSFANIAALQQQAVDAATAACKSAGILSEPFLEPCILDVAETEDQDFASAAAAVQNFTNASADASDAGPARTSVATPVPAATPTATATTATASVPTGTVTKMVLGTAGPWKFVSGGLNAAFPYSEKDRAGFPTAPTIFSANDGLTFTAGGTLHVRYVSGGVAQSAGYARVDANGNKGYACSDPRPLANGHCPSTYTSGPHLVSELIGVFTDASGTIVGKPFVIGNSADLTVPAGAAALSMGVNDSGYFNNVGSLQIAVN